MFVKNFPCMVHIIKSSECLASTPGRPIWERRPGIDLLRMHRFFCILSNKLNCQLIIHEGLVPFEVEGELIRYYNMKSLRRVYDYQVFRVI